MSLPPKTPAQELEEHFAEAQKQFDAFVAGVRLNLDVEIIRSGCECWICNHTRLDRARRSVL